MTPSLKTNANTSPTPVILKYLRVVVFPLNFKEALIATIFAFAVLTLGFFNPLAIPISSLFSGSYNTSMMSIYELILRLGAIPFGINLVLFATAKRFESITMAPMTIHLILLLTCGILGILATYSCSWPHLGGCS